MCSVTLIRSNAGVRRGSQMKPNVKSLFVVGDMDMGVPAMKTLRSMAADITIGLVTTANNQPTC